MKYFFLQKIKESHKSSLPLKLINENSKIIDLDVTATKEYDGGQLQINDIDSGTMFIPTRWNQGCFDAVHYKTYIRDDSIRKKFSFFNATLAETHNYKFQYIAKFLKTIFEIPPMRQSLSENIDVVMAAVTSHSMFLVHRTDGGDTSALPSVQIYDEDFGGHVIKYQIDY